MNRFKEKLAGYVVISFLFGMIAGLSFDLFKSKYYEHQNNTLKNYNDSLISNYEKLEKSNLDSVNNLSESERIRAINEYINRGSQVSEK